VTLADCLAQNPTTPNLPCKPLSFLKSPGISDQNSSISQTFISLISLSLIIHKEGDGVSWSGICHACQYVTSHNIYYVNFGIGKNGSLLEGSRKGEKCLEQDINPLKAILTILSKEGPCLGLLLTKKTSYRANMKAALPSNQKCGL
jgi:hypothetical protein